MPRLACFKEDFLIQPTSVLFGYRMETLLLLQLCNFLLLVDHESWHWLLHSVRVKRGFSLNNHSSLLLRSNSTSFVPFGFNLPLDSRLSDLFGWKWNSLIGIGLFGQLVVISILVICSQLVPLSSLFRGNGSELLGYLAHDFCLFDIWILNSEIRLFRNIVE